MNYRHLLGVPYKHDGRDLKGLDCYGLVMQVYKLFGIELPDYASIVDLYLIDRMIKTISFNWIKLDEPEIPCAVTFWIINPDFVSHIGVVIEKDRFIHVRQRIPVCIEKLSSPIWSKRIAGFYRWKNIKTNL